jgi:hypothetical protein
MGGVAAWREMEREKMAGGRWGEGDERDARDARDDGDERDDGNERDEREEREEREERAETVEGGDDDVSCWMMVRLREAANVSDRALRWI